MEDYYRSFDIFFKWMMVFVISMIAITVVVGVTSYSESKEACEDFGGKLSGQMNCIRKGVSYDIENKGMMTLKKQIVRKAVDINYAVQEAKE